MSLNPNLSKAFDTISDWLEYKVSSEFDIEFNVGREIIMHDLNNSGQIKIGKTYTDKVTNNEHLKNYLDHLIDSALSGKVTLADMQQELDKHRDENESE